MPQQENTSKLTINGNYAIVKYELGWTLRDLLQIYGIPEKRTDLVRSVLKGNDLAYSNNVLTLSNGRPIPQGKIIQMPTRVVSPSILEKVKSGEKAGGTPGPAQVAKAAKAGAAPAPVRQLGKPSDFLAVLPLLWQDKTTRLMVYGGAAALLIGLVTIIAITVLGDRASDADARSSKAADAVETRAARTQQSTLRVDPTPRRETEKREFSAKNTPPLTASKPRAQELAARKNTPAASTPSVISLEPGQKIVDMRNVDTLSISQNSSKEEIVRVIEAFNEIHSPKNK